MAFSPLNNKITVALDVLEAMYFFTQSSGANQNRLRFIRNSFEGSPRDIRLNLLDELKEEIEWLRTESGAIASDGEFVRFFRKVQQETRGGQVFIPKWEIDRRWFGKFSRVFARWPFVKDHAMVIYDPFDLSVRNQIFELEGALFTDAEVLLDQARLHHKGIKDFKQRSREDQFLLHTYLRKAATAVFQYLEAYVNGLAFDCLHRYHNKLSEADHDLLAEWNRKKDARSFVPTDKKIFQYPAVFAKHAGVKLDLSGCKAAHFLASDAKELRDALTHPSPHMDSASQTLKKIGLITTVTLERADRVFQASRDYTLEVETALSGKPGETAPWLFPRPK